MRILKAYGIPPNLLQAIEKMYTNTKAKVISPDGETEMFDITTGVLQGDTCWERRRAGIYHHPSKIKKTP